MNSTLRLRPASLVAAAVAIVLAQNAVAQEEPTALGEITVTARKRAESLQDVPFAISARTGDQLAAAGASNIEDVSRNVAGFTVLNLGPGQSQAAIRGVSGGKIDRDLPGVKEQIGVYMDESAISRLYRDQKILEIGEGTNEVQRMVIARHLDLPPSS